MAIRIDIETGDICFACLVPREQTPSNEEWCFDGRGRPLCGQCARDEQIIYEPWTDTIPGEEISRHSVTGLAHFLR